MSMLMMLELKMEEFIVKNKHLAHWREDMEEVQPGVQKAPLCLGQGNGWAIFQGWILMIRICSGSYSLGRVGRQLGVAMIDRRADML